MLCNYLSLYHIQLCKAVKYIYNIYIYIYMQPSKQCTLRIITTMALWQLMHFCITVRHVPKCMSCRKAMIIGRAHCFHDCILLWDLSTLCSVDQLKIIFKIYTLYFYIYFIYIYLPNILLIYLRFIDNMFFTGTGNKKDLMKFLN